MQVSVIVPAYNEADNITEVIDRLHAALSGLTHEIIVVDDDSPDGTWRLAREHAAGDPSVRVIRRIAERGLASAVLAGMAASQGEALAVIDGDLQHDESVLSRMVSCVLGGTADVCVGARRNYGDLIVDRSRLRRFVTRTGSALVERLLPLLRRTSDPLSGYFVLSRDCYERNAVAINRNLRQYKILWAFIARDRSLAIADVGYDFRPRSAGFTKLSGAILFDDLVNALVLRFGRVLSPLFVKYCIVGVSGVMVSLVGFGLGELAGMPRINSSLSPDLNPVYTSALLGIELSIISNFLANNYFTFYDRRYRGWDLLRGLGLFHTVAIVGVFVQLAMFQLLHRNDFPAVGFDEDISATINNGIGLAFATITNFFLNVSITWNRQR